VTPVVLARTHAATVIGIHAFPVEVEVDLQDGLPSFATVGLPDAAVRESRDRVRAALINSGFPPPEGRVTVSLAPGDLRKEGSGFDLAIAVGLLVAAGFLPPSPASDYLFVGELSLDGGMKAVRGILPMAIAARAGGFRGMVVPPSNGQEAALVRDLDVYTVGSLGEAADFFLEEKDLQPFREGPGTAVPVVDRGNDFGDVRGQEAARRALEVAAAGAHNVLMMGPPGAGKTMLAHRLTGVLPAMTFEESLQTTRISSVAGLLSPERPLVRERPFRAPHHTVSSAGMAGGGSRPRPGEITLAHKGVLFLDELPEFSRSVLEVLRQPLEEGEVTISRAALSLTYPAEFMLVAAMNPCKCGFLGHPTRECRCTPREVERYRGRISGPLLDRIDIHLEVPALEYGELMGEEAGEASAVIRARVERVRHLQQRRFGEERTTSNAGMSAGQVREHCRLDRGSDNLLKSAVERLGLSARGITRVLKVARTIADLDGIDAIGQEHVAEAVQYRSLDRGIP
jgi:magnesium chelatase family protein